MAITYQGSSLIDHDNGPGNLPYSLQPAAIGAVSGDLFIVQFSHDPTNTNTPPSYSTVPADAVELIAPSAPPENFIGSSVWWLPYEGGSPTWTWQTTAGYEYSGSGGSLQYLWMRGVDLDNPLASTVGEKPFSGANATTHTAPSVTTTVDGAYVIGGFNTGSASTAITAPSGWTARTDSDVRDGVIATKGIQATAGPTGTASWVRDGSQRGQAWQVALRPGSDEPPPTPTPTLVYQLVGGLS